MRSPQSGWQVAGQAREMFRPTARCRIRSASVGVIVPEESTSQVHGLHLLAPVAARIAVKA